MPDITINAFKRGVDVLRPPYAAAPGVLTIGEDVVLTPQGDIEVRKEFVAAYSVAGTFGLQTVADDLVVFGHLASPIPAVPTGVVYQQLVSSDSVYPVAVLSTDLFNGKIYCAALMDDGTRRHYYDGVEVDDWFDGRARGLFDITGGAAGSVTNVKVNGVEVLNTPVAWTTSNTATAAAVAAQINSYTSSPDYTAVSVGATVVVQALAAAGSGPNGYVIEVTASGGLTYSTPIALSGGIDAGITPTPGAFVKTHKTKMYALSGSVTLFSSIDGPVYWNLEYDGAGFVDLAASRAGAENLVACEEFYAKLAIFAKKQIQIWSMFADDLNNNLEQTIDNAGTLSPKSVTKFGGNEIIYLDPYRGMCSLRRSSDYNTDGTLDELGMPLWPELGSTASQGLSGNLREHLAGLTAAQIENAAGVIEPGSGRYMCAIGERVYVLSSFRPQEVEGWTVFLTPGIEITDWAVLNGRLYGRAGNTVYLYGGPNDTSYPAANVGKVRLPSFRADDAAKAKNFLRANFVLEGEWEAWVYANRDDTAGRRVAVIADQTLDNMGGVPLAESDTNPILEMRRIGTGYARLCKLKVDYR